MRKTTTHISFIVFAGILLFPSITFSQNHFWELTESPPGAQIYTITSNAKSELYISTAPKYNYGSTDDGQTWSMLYDNLTVVDMGCSMYGEIYAASSFGDIYYSKGFGYPWDFNSRVSQPVLAFTINPADYMYLASYAGGIYRSIDKGGTWSQIGNGIPPGFRTNNFASDSANGEMFAATDKGLFTAQDYGTSWRNIWNDTSNVLSVAAASDRTLYAGTMSLGIYKSTDHGNSWISLDSLFLRKAIRHLICTKNKNVIAAAGNDLYASSDAGSSWFAVQLDESIMTKLHLTRTGVVYAVSKGRVFRSRDEGLTWEKIPFYNPVLTSMNTFPNGAIYCTTSDGEIYRLRNGTKSWVKVQLPIGTTKGFFVKPDANGSIILKGDSNIFYRSSDEGFTWKSWKSRYNLKDVVFSKNDYPIIATQAGLYSSTNGGVTWDNLGLGNIQIFTIISDRAQSLFAGTMNAGVYHSDDGVQWQSMNVGLPQDFLSVNYLWIDSLNNLYAQGSGTKYGLFRYINASGSWKQVGKNLPDPNINSVTVDMNNTLYLTFPSKGVCYSTDLGENWTFINDGLSTTKLNFIAPMKDERMLVATNGEGLFRSTGNVVNIRDAYISKSGFTLYPNYPNPFSSSTSITYRLSSRGHVRLEVFDLLGRKVAMLVDEEKEMGDYTSLFDIRNSRFDIHPGVYFYRLIIGKNVMTRKMIVTE